MYFGYIFCLNPQGLALRLRLTCRCFGIWMVHISHVGQFFTARFCAGLDTRNSMAFQFLFWL